MEGEGRGGAGDEAVGGEHGVVHVGHAAALEAEGHLLKHWGRRTKRRGNVNVSERVEETTMCWRSAGGDDRIVCVDAQGRG